jgi:hypothetical protein
MLWMPGSDARCSQVDSIMINAYQGVCGGCGITYLTGSRTSKWCSQRCCMKAYNQRRKARQQQPAQLQLMPAGITGMEVRTWQGTQIQRRDSDGYVNATAMCKANGREWFTYARSERTKEYLQALQGSPQICGDLVATITTGPNDQRGTWIHPRLAVDLARWISAPFAVWMDGWFLDSIASPAGPSINRDDAHLLIAAADDVGKALVKWSCALAKLSVPVGATIG